MPGKTMRLNLRHLHLLLFLLAVLCAGTAAAGSPGGTGAQFLKIGVGARPSAMGEAFTGVSGDIDSIMWNPSGLARLDTLQQTFMHNVWLEGISLDYAAIAHRINDVSAFGLGLEYVSIGDMDRIDNTGAELGYYNAYDLMGVASYARKIKENIDAGANLKIIKQKIENERASGMALDLGAMYHLPRYRFGLAIKNIGPSIMFGDAGTAYPLPMAIRLGGSFSVSKNLAVSSDINLPSDSGVSFHAGGEYVYSRIRDMLLSVRAGLKTDTMSYLDAMSGISLGFGVQWREWGVDYALVPYGALGSTHRLSLVTRFKTGEVVRVVETQAEKAAPLPAERKEEPVRVETRKPQEMYYDVLQWFNAKTEKDNLPKPEQLMILERIRERFEPLGIDITAVKKMIEQMKKQ